MPLSLRYGVGGWRKHAAWKKEIKITRREFEKAASGGGGIMGPGSETAESVPNADRLLARFGPDAILSLSFDKGFSSAGDRELIELFIPEVIMPEKGRNNQADVERENTPRWKKLRNQHSAVESNMNSLEHHGLNRCPDKRLTGYQRYVGFGVLAYNLHKIGAKLLANQSKEKEKLEKEKPGKAEKKAA